jgi:hypothetical protein
LFGSSFSLPEHSYKDLCEEKRYKINSENSGLLASFPMKLSLVLFFFQTLSLPFPAHLSFFLPPTRTSLHAF